MKRIIKKGAFYYGGFCCHYFLNNKSSQRKTSQQVNQNITADKTLQQKNMAPVTSTMNGDADETKKNNVDAKRKKVSSQTTMQLFSSKNDIATGVVASNSDKISGLKKGKVSSEITSGQVDDNKAASANIDSANFNGDITSVDKKIDIVSSVIPADTIGKKDSSKNSVAQNLPDGNKNSKTKKDNTSGFYFIASIAADIASVKFLSFKNSQLATKFGIGIGYQFNNKISLQTGFYAGRKKYIAGPEDYYPKTGSYWDMVQIVKVDASCLVYDIPLTVRYNFLLKPTTIYYATAGFSSFIMKEEDYYYYYTNNNMPHESAYTYTGNKHFFSVFNISAGIEKKLSSNFSLLAEPSLSIPISGVGDGSVKLYSAALQVGVKYNPHRKHK